VRKLTERFRELSFEWVPREENEEADLLSKKRPPQQDDQFKKLDDAG
jgi:ribonuclease HI